MSDIPENPKRRDCSANVFSPSISCRSGHTPSTDCTCAAAGHGAAARAADRDLDAVVALFEAATRLEDRRPRAGVSALLEEIAAQEIPAAPMEERVSAHGAVRLLTAHRSKGLEWDLVVVAGVQDGV